MDFEKKLNKLESIVENMESGELSLDDSLKKFEEGIKLSRECTKVLSDAEVKVQALVGDKGNLSTETFTEE